MGCGHQLGGPVNVFIVCSGVQGLSGAGQAGGGWVGVSQTSVIGLPFQFPSVNGSNSMLFHCAGSGVESHLPVKQTWVSHCVNNGTSTPVPPSPALPHLTHLPA